MAHGWKSKTQFRRLSLDLAKLESKGFERGVLPYLRMLYENACEAIAFGSMDSSGVDIVVPSGIDGKFTLGVQCKGFAVADAEIGSSQIDQCLKSIRKFARSSFPMEEYWLVHNRTAAGKGFHDAVQDELKKLVQDGRVTTVRLLDRDEFLARVFNGVFRRFRRFVGQKAIQFRQEYGDRLGLSESPIAQVPYLVQEVRVSQHGFDDLGTSFSQLGDPAVEFVTQEGSSRSRLGLLLGEFGMGKTTLALRLATRPDYVLLYVPAATFPPSVSGTKELLKHLFDMDDFLVGFCETDHPLIERMARLMSEKLLSENSNKFMLVIDGLDESPLLTHSVGFTTLFDALSNIRASAVLTMRTEFWRARVEAFLAGYEGRAAPQKRSDRNRRLMLIELAPWANEQIARLINEALEVEGGQGRVHLEALKQLVNKDSYGSLYGDIPRKPLFLRILIEFVAEHGVGKTSLAQLFRQWIKHKIHRDTINPQIVGGSGRRGVSGGTEPLDVIQLVALQAMKAAAVLMTLNSCERIDLLPDCDFQRLTNQVPALNGNPVSSDNYKWFAATIKTDPRRQLPTGVHVQGEESLIFA